MHTNKFSNAPGYLIILIGLMLSVVSAVIPHFNVGYKFTGSLLVVGMLPYMVYGIAVPLLHNMLTTAVGIIVVIAHLWLVIYLRINADYSNDLIYYAPIAASLLLMPLAYIALKRSSIDARDRKPDQPSPEE